MTMRNGEQQRSANYIGSAERLDDAVELVRGDLTCCEEEETPAPGDAP